MLSIRLSRVGTKNAPSYRIVVMPKHRDPWAKTTEIIGQYNPKRQPKVFEVKTDRVKHWIAQGAEVSDSLWNLLVEHKIVEGKKRGVSTISKTRREKLKKEIDEKKAKDEEAKKKAEEAKQKAEEEARAKAEAEAAEKAAAEEAAKVASEASHPEEAKADEGPAEPAPVAPAEEKSGEAGSGPAGKEE